MRWLLILLICVFALPSWATVRTVSLSWQPDPSWQVAAGGTYLDLPVESITASRRLAIRFFNGLDEIGTVWDDPDNRSVNISVDMGASPIAHIRGQAVAYECGPWRSTTAFAQGDLVCNGAFFPSTKFSMVATTAGTTGAVEPEWPAKHSFRLALAKTISASAAINNGDGTVGIPVTGHPYFAGQAVVISGSVNYNGTHILPDQSLGGANVVVITASFVAETFAGTESISIANSSVVDNGNGTVSLPCPGCSFAAGQDVTVDATTNYDGTYILGVQADPDWLTIPATYVAEQITGGYAIDTTVADGSVVWTFTDATPDLVVLESEPTRRIIGRATGTGQLRHSGTRFTVGHGP